MSSSGFSQLIHEPTHIQHTTNQHTTNQGNSSSFIDLVFTDQPNLSVNSGVHASPHPNCHHQVVHSGFKLSIKYLSPYLRLIWNYKKLIQKILEKLMIR